MVTIKRRLMGLTKRAVDLVVLILLAPVLGGVGGVTYLAILLTMGRPVIFVQLRTGYKGRLFSIYKFRSMIRGDTVLQDDAERITPIGRFLRRTSMDELPNFVNILIGQMTLVGPRPLLPEYLPRYSVRQGTRFDVKPGITGLSQARARNDASWASRLRLDQLYVDKKSLALDFAVLCWTVGRVFSGTGVNQRGEATVRAFDGSN